VIHCPGDRGLQTTMTGRTGPSRDTFMSFLLDSCRPVAVASAGFTRPAHPTPATLAAATTRSWALAFDVSAGPLLAAAVASGCWSA